MLGDVEVQVMNQLVFQAESPQGVFSAVQESEGVYKVNFENRHGEGFKDIVMSFDSLQTLYILLATTLGQSLEEEENEHDETQ